jgi:hypothetical protein
MRRTMFGGEVGFDASSGTARHMATKRARRGRTYFIIDDS